MVSQRGKHSKHMIDFKDFKPPLDKNNIIPDSNFEAELKEVDSQVNVLRQMAIDDRVKPGNKP